MTTLDEQIATMRIEDQAAKVKRLQNAYFRASDRVEAALRAVETAKDAKARAAAAMLREADRLYAMEHPEENA
jgi:hypothetical protein